MLEGRDGLEVIDRTADRLRGMLVVFEEHHTDAELASVTEFLALATMLIAERAGFEHVFYPEDLDDPRAA